MKKLLIVLFFLIFLVCGWRIENAFAFDLSVDLAKDLGQLLGPDTGPVVASQAATYALTRDMNLGARSSLQIVDRRVETSVESGGEVEYVALTLTPAANQAPGGDAEAGLGTIRLMLRGPKGFLEDRTTSYQTLFVASGLFAGRDTVKLVNNLDRMVIVGYEYPYSLESVAHQPKRFVNFFRQTPAQIAATLQWISEQGWQNPYELYTVGVSLGGLFLPSAVHIAQSLGVPVRGSIFAFTGADLPSTLHHVLEGRIPPETLQVASQGLAGLAALHDPALHLPYLRGRFLTIRALSDQVFPAEASIRVEQLLPQPKSIQVIEGTHIDTGATELIRKTQQLIREWLGR